MTSVAVGQGVSRFNPAKGRKDLGTIIECVLTEILNRDGPDESPLHFLTVSILVLVGRGYPDLVCSLGGTVQI